MTKTMNGEIVKNVSNVTPYKQEKFEQFKKLIKDGKVENWLMIAEALGIHFNTVYKWKEHPDAQQAIVNGITHAIDQMEKAGKRDWRMWHEKLKMLGVRVKEGTQTLIDQRQININEGERKEVLSADELAGEMVDFIESVERLREAQEERGVGSEKEESSSGYDERGGA